MNRIVAFTMSVLMSLLIISCRNQPTGGNTSQTVKVKIIDPEKVSASFPIRASGLLASKTEVKLSFKTGGLIENIYINEGQSVEAGQLLAQLNLSEIGSLVQQARLGYEKALRDLQRAENLYNDSVATLEQLQNARTAFDYAESQLQIADFNSRYSKIIAPSKGKVLKKLAEKNEMIAPGYPLFIFSSSEGDWLLRVSVSDVNVVKIQINDSASIRFDAFPESVFQGIVSEIAKSSDPYTGTYEVELRIVGRQAGFVSGLVGKANIFPSNKNNYVSIPLNVIHEADEMHGYIFVVRNNSYERKLIDILAISGDRVYIADDFPVNEKIISDGADYLTPGSLIEVVQ